MHLALARPELISLAAGFVDQATLPVDATARAAARVLREPRAGQVALQYGTTAGLPELRDAVLGRHLAADGVSRPSTRLSVDNVVLTAGSNQLLRLVAEVLLDPGDIVLCASPTYFVFLGMLAGLGVSAVGIEADDEGLVPEALEATLQRLAAEGRLARVKLLYVTSYHDNPSNVTLPTERRARIVELIERYSRKAKIYILEDAAYRELRYGRDDLPSLRSHDKAGDTVIVAETFSKSFSPGVRVGWGILPKELVGPVRDLKGNIDFGSPAFNQYLMAEVLEAGDFEPHVALLRDRYQTKLAAMLAAADEHSAPIEGVRWGRPSGGLYLWLRLPDWLDAGLDGALFQASLAGGMLYVPGEYCFPLEGPAPRNHTIRLSFGVQSAENIARGVAALATAIRAQAASSSA